MTGKGWEISEAYGMGIPNPGSVTKIILPNDWSEEQKREFVEELKLLYPEDRNGE